MSQTLSKHAHILFSEDEYKFLRKIARTRKKPVGELVRLAVRKVYGEGSEGEKKAAGMRLLQKKDLIVANWEDMERELLGRYD